MRKRGQAIERTWRMPLAAGAVTALLYVLGAPSEPLRAQEQGEVREDEDEVAPRVRYSIDEARGRPGQIVSLHVGLFTESTLSAAAFAIRFDSRVLRVERIEPLLDDALGGELPETVDVRFSNDRSDAPAGSLSGWIYVRVADRDRLAVAAFADIKLWRIDFLIRRSANELAGERELITPVRFGEIRLIEEPDRESLLTNVAEFDSLVDNQREIPPEDREDGRVIILGLGEIGFFRRADANQDCEIDVSDPLFTFNRLFVAHEKPPCPDAADSNDDGELDISDGIYTLRWLFLRGAPPPEPVYFGRDPTEDALDCEHAYADVCSTTAAD